MSFNKNSETFHEQPWKASLFYCSLRIKIIILFIPFVEQDTSPSIMSSEVPVYTLLGAVASLI